MTNKDKIMVDKMMVARMFCSKMMVVVMVLILHNDDEDGDFIDGDDDGIDNKVRPATQAFF